WNGRFKLPARAESGLDHSECLGDQRSRRNHRPRTISQSIACSVAEARSRTPVVSADFLVCRPGIFAAERLGEPPTIRSPLINSNTHRNRPKVLGDHLARI